MPLRPPWLPPAALVLALSSGCRTTEFLEPPRAAELRAADPLPVTLSPGLRRWKEDSVTQGTRTRYRLGTLLERLFPASDGRSFLHATSSQLETSFDGRTGLWNSTFTFTLVLQRDGRSSPIQAVGHGASAEGPQAADREAIEDSVGAVYSQAAALLAGQDG